MRYAEKLFRDLHPGVLPKHGSAAQWQAVATLAFKNQGDIVDSLKRHTSRSRFWAKVGDAAALRAGLAAEIEAQAEDYAAHAWDRAMTNGAAIERHFASRER